MTMRRPTTGRIKTRTTQHFRPARGAVGWSSHHRSDRHETLFQERSETAMIRFMKALLVEEDGATMVEYALMVALIAAAAITVVGTLSTNLNGKFTSVSTAIK